MSRQMRETHLLATVSNLFLALYDFSLRLFLMSRNMSGMFLHLIEMQKVYVEVLLLMKFIYLFWVLCLVVGIF